MKQSNAALREISTGDIEAVAEYLSQNFKQSATEWQQIMQHWWFDNPAAAQLPSLELGWVLESSGDIVGFLGNIPTRFQHEGEDLVVFNPTTWFVDEAHRGTPQSRELFFQFGSAADQSLSFITTPGAHVVRFYRQQMGYVDFPLKPTHAAIHVFDYRQSLNLNSHSKKRWLRWPLLPIYQLKQRLSKKTIKSQLSIKRVNDIGPEFDSLWQQTRQTYADTQCRSAESLRWLMGGRTEESKFLIGAYEQQKLLGFGIFKHGDHPIPQSIECVDLWWDHAHPQSIYIPAAIIQAIRDQQTKLGIGSATPLIKIPLFNAKVAQACGLLGMACQPLNGHYYMLRYGEKIREQQLSENHYLSGVHGDYLLF